jgi:hypothetical protein
MTRFLVPLAILLFAAPLVSLPARATGAIAVDADGGATAEDVGYGFAVNQPDRHRAERDAVRRCESATGNACHPVVWFETCGAYASSRRHHGIGFGDSKHVAIHAALENCDDDHCRIVVAACE